jgi:hypothetical protein
MSKVVNGTVDDIDDRELLARVLRYIARRGTGKREYLWAIVAERFALGSTYSQQLCRRYAFDPDEVVRR